MKKQIKIDFIGIGAQKSGTSWLAANLRKIPEFDLPPKKEFHYFDRNPKYPTSDKLSKTFLSQRISFDYLSDAFKSICYSLLKGRFKDAKFYSKWNFSTYSDEWYLSLFEDFNGYTGEISPSYSVINEEDVRLMHGLIPNAKLILLLRNPVKRAWSHYRHKGGNRIMSSTETLDIQHIIEFMKNDSQMLKSNYRRTIENFSKVYPKNQILIGFFDAIIGTPERLLEEITTYICGDTNISINPLNLKKPINQSIKINCPKEVEHYLKIEYYDLIKYLAESYGGYFNKWLEDTYGESSSNENKILSPTMFIP